MICKVTSLIDQRPTVLNFLKEKKFERVLDIGGGHICWAKDYVTDILDFDFKDPCFDGSNHRKIFGDLDYFETFNLIMDHVKAFGKWDFLICSQTLEHLGAPHYWLRMFSHIAERGYVEVPCMSTEMARLIYHEEGQLSTWGIRTPIRGFAPHKWLFTTDRDQDNIVIWPKLPLLEQLYLPQFDDRFISNGNDGPVVFKSQVNPQAFSFFFEGYIPTNVYDDRRLGLPDGKDTIDLIKKEMKDWTRCETA